MVGLQQIVQHRGARRVAQAVADLDEVAQTRLPQRVARNRGKIAVGEPLELGLGLGQPIEIRIDQRQTRTPGRTGAAFFDEVPDERRDLARAVPARAGS